MIERDKMSLIVDSLITDPVLEEIICTALPQAILMPFAHEREKCYVTIALFFTAEIIRKNPLVDVCKHVLKILRLNQLTIGLDGVEILACLVKDGKTERLFRLSVLSHALRIAEELEAKDIEHEEPVDGITCLFYKANIS